MLSDEVKSLISAFFVGVNAFMLSPFKNMLPPRIIYRGLSECLDWMFPNDIVVDVFEILFKEITYDLNPSFCGMA